MDGGAWWVAVHGVAEGRTRLSNFTFTGSPNVETMVLLEKTKKKPAAKNKFAAKGKPAAKRNQDPAVSNRAKKRLASRGDKGARRPSGSDRPGKTKSVGKPRAKR